MSVRFLTPSDLPPSNGYSHVVETSNGRTVYISGQIALDAQGQLVGEHDLAMQTTQVFENIAIALEAVGLTFDHVIKFSFFLLDITQVPIVRLVRDRYINLAHPPASSAFEVRRLIRDDLLIEIEAIAFCAD